MVERPDDMRIVVVDGSELRRGWRAKVTRPIAGIALGVLGAVFILVGYLGVAHETLVAKQIPYLVSGGIGGMVLVAVGAFLLGTDDVRKQLERVEHLEALVGDLHRTLLQPEGTAADALAAAPTAPAPASRGANGTGALPVVPAPETGLVALARGKSFHRTGCTMVAGKQADPVDASTIAGRSLSPCPLCDPVPSGAAQ